MDSLVLLVSLSLLSFLCEAGTPTTEFVQTGNDLLLKVRETVTLKELDHMTWIFNDSKNIAKLADDGRIKFFSDFSGRAELQNQSLLLKKLTKSDSGDYKAEVSDDKRKEIAHYKVTVLDPVSPVKLTVKSCSSVSSNLTVICSTQDSLISTTFTCDDQSCSEERGEFNTPAASLKVYLENGSIICVHRNPINSTEDVRKIEDLCKKGDGPQVVHSNKKVLSILLPIIGVILLLLIIIGVYKIYIYRQKTREYKTQSMENTVYEVPQVNPNLPLQERPINETPSNDLPPTIYHLLGHPIESEAPTGAAVKTLPESVYATVQKTPKT